MRFPRKPVAHFQSSRKYRLGGSRWLKLRGGVCEPLPYPTFPSIFIITPLCALQPPPDLQFLPPNTSFPYQKCLPPPTTRGNVAGERNAIRSWLNCGVGEARKEKLRCLEGGSVVLVGADGRVGNEEDRRAETARRFVTVTRALTSSGECTREEALFYGRFAPLLYVGFRCTKLHFRCTVSLNRC